MASLPLETPHVVFPLTRLNHGTMDWNRRNPG